MIWLLAWNSNVCCLMKTGKDVLGLVRRSVGRSVGQSVGRPLFWARPVRTRAVCASLMALTSFIHLDEWDWTDCHVRHILQAKERKGTRERERRKRGDSEKGSRQKAIKRGMRKTTEI